MDATDPTGSCRVCRLLAILSLYVVKKVIKIFGAAAKSPYLCTVKTEQAPLGEATTQQHRLTIKTKDKMIRMYSLVCGLTFLRAQTQMIPRKEEVRKVKNEQQDIPLKR